MTEVSEKGLESKEGVFEDFCDFISSVEPGTAKKHFLVNFRCPLELFKV